MYVVTVTFEVKPEFAEEFGRLVRKHSENSLGEAGCRRFDVAFDPENPARCFLFEAYDDLAAFETHTKTPYFAEFGAKVEPNQVSRELNFWVMASPE